MKKIFLVAIIALISQVSFSQGDDIIIRLHLENPQPRQGELLSYSIDFRHFSRMIWNTQDDPKGDPRGEFANRLSLGHKSTEKIGKFTIPSMSFTFNDVNYKTEELEYEVIEKLPDNAEGLWIRFVKMYDDQIAVIVEERRRLGNVYTQDDFFKKKAYFHFSKMEELIWVSGYQSMPRLTDQSIRGNIQINIIKKKDPTKKLVITKDYFTNLPADYNFIPFEF